jgi:hypothetical protein
MVVVVNVGLHQQEMVPRDRSGRLQFSDLLGLLLAALAANSDKLHSPFLLLWHFNVISNHDNRLSICIYTLSSSSPPPPASIVSSAVKMTSVSSINLSMGLLLFPLLWHLRVFRSSLSYIPGPPSASRWTGEPIIAIYSDAPTLLTQPMIGNLSQLLSTNAWSFHEYLYKTFGTVARLRTLFNVRSSLIYLFRRLSDRLTPGPAR